MFRCEIDGNINVFGPIYEIQYIKYVYVYSQWLQYIQPLSISPRLLCNEHFLILISYLLL